MHPSALWHFYSCRLRKHWVQECLAGLGIAVGVSLVFAVLVADSSITASSRQAARDLSGAAAWQVMGRDSRGFSEGVVAEIEGVAGVRRVAPILEQRARLITSGGKKVDATIAGVDARVAGLSGAVTSDLGARGLRVVEGLVLPAALARTLGVERGASGGDDRRLFVHMRGRFHRSRIAARLGPETIGSLASSLIAIAPLGYLQQLAGLPGRVTRVLVETDPGREDEVRSALLRLTGGRVDVERTDVDSQLLEQAVKPSDQATRFFALIACLVGLLLAANAMLLTAPERRRVIAGLRMQGYRRGQAALVLLSQAVLLGIAASLVGLAAGYLLAREVFDTRPQWLAGAFAVGTETIVTLGPLLVSFVGGVIATCIAAAPPLFDLRRSRSRDEVYREGGHPGQGLSRRARQRLLLAGIGLVISTTALLLAGPAAAIVAVAGLAFATVLVIPASFAATTSVSEAVAGRLDSLHLISVTNQLLRARTLTALALTATGAVAVYGSVAIGGARDDLLDGIERFVDQHTQTAPLWIINEMDHQATRDFRRGDLPERVAAVPGVAAVREYYGSFLNLAGRRVWVIGRPPTDRVLVPPQQIVTGNKALAARRLAQGGWITLSAQIATQLGARVGDAINLPTPTGRKSLRLAATTTNLAWSPGALIINSTDYRRAWDTKDPSALEVDVTPGESVEAVQRRISRALGPTTALRVLTAHQRVEQAVAQTRQGLERLGQITTLLLIAAALAMAAALGAAIWQRRPALALLRRQTYRPGQLRIVLLAEATLVLGTGCIVGALTALYGQALIDRYLTLATGYSTPFGLDPTTPAKTTLIVVLTALAVVAIPGYIASHTPRNLGLIQE